jgi:hypothetical protein
MYKDKLMKENYFNKIKNYFQKLDIKNFNTNIKSQKTLNLIFYILGTIAIILTVKVYFNRSGFINTLLPFGIFFVILAVFFKGTSFPKTIKEIIWWTGFLGVAIISIYLILMIIVTIEILFSIGFSAFIKTLLFDILLIIAIIIGIVTLFY